LIKDNPELADELEVKIKARIKELAELKTKKREAKANFFFIILYLKASFFDVTFRNLVIENKLYHVLLPD
jgi:hypothetical protein